MSLVLEHTPSPTSNVVHSFKQQDLAIGTWCNRFYPEVKEVSTNRLRPQAMNFIRTRAKTEIILVDIHRSSKTMDARDHVLRNAGPNCSSHTIYHCRVFQTQQTSISWRRGSFATSGAIGVQKSCFFSLAPTYICAFIISAKHFSMPSSLCCFGYATP